MLLTTKKRPSPDSDAMRALSSPGSERKSKRAKVEGIRFLGRRQERSEYHEPLRDPGAITPGRPCYKRASSMRPTSSPGKPVSSIFPFRAQSVPLGGENEVRSIDFTCIPPSPRRSPGKGTIEVRRAPSIPPPNEERMDIDVHDAATLLHFTNPTHAATPRPSPVFCYAVNFATPRGTGTSPHTSLPFASPLSPLTPLPPSPPTRRLPEMRSLLARAQLSLTSNDSIDTMPSPTALEKEVDSMRVAAVVDGSSQARGLSSIDPDNIAGESMNALVNLSMAPGSQPDLNPTSTSRSSIIRAMKPKQSPSLSKGSKRVTRSVSMLEKRVKGEHAEIKDTTVEVSIATTNTVDGSPSEAAEMPPPLTTAASKPLPPKPTGVAASKSKPPLTARRSASVSKLPTDSNKFKQTSLATFVKAKPSAVKSTSTISDSIASTSTGIEAPSRVVLHSSPSKIPLPTSPSKRLATSHTKPFLFSLGSTTSSAGTGTSRGLSGRSLITLSHALGKLAAPPPSRPNTSMGFVRGEVASGEDGSLENSKGKGKAKDDASLPLPSTKQGSVTTFGRPTASSLNRAATVAGFGSTVATKMRGRGGVGGSGRGRGVGGIFGRAGDRASKKTSLPVVAGSPVKGSGITDDLDRVDPGAGGDQSTQGSGGAENATDVRAEEDVFLSQHPPTSESLNPDVVMQESSMGSHTSQKLTPSAATNANNGIDVDLTTSPISRDKGKQRAVPPSMLNPASSALHALSESLSSLPQTPTPPKPRAVGTRTGLRSSSVAVGKESPAIGGSAGNSDIHDSGGAGPSNGTVNGSGGVKKSTLKILKRCAIFVDVRTEQGDDAGCLFVDMLKGLGARIMGRVGQKCTHIVYKNGLPNTLARYRMLNDPKPFVVGIAWVVECVEKRAKIDEEKFKIDVDLINVADGNRKRRRSMFPKYLIPTSPGPDYDIPVHVSLEADEDDGGIDGSPSQDPDLSFRSREEDDLPPLERARKRRSILPGGQTRLVP